MSQKVVTGQHAGAKQRSTPSQLVEALHAAFGDHHARAVHAKGIILHGVLQPDAHAAALTKAAHLQNAKSDVIVRFSDFTGIPDIADGNPGASPRGLSVKFRLPNGDTTDIVAHSFNGFPAATSDEFRELLLAIGASGPGVAKPTQLDKFLAAHPVAKTFLTTQRIPASFATIAYFGVNSFEFTNASGESRFGRYQFIPDAGEQILSGEEAAAKGANFLLDEIDARVAKGPFSFTMYAQLAEAGDKIEDPSVAWPDDRTRISLGKIVIDALAPNTAEEDKQLVFIPGDVPDGITIADPMLDTRSKAYPISADERQAG